MKASKLPRKLKKLCKKTVLLWTCKKSKDIKIVNYNKTKRTFEYRSNK